MNLSKTVAEFDKLSIDLLQVLDDKEESRKIAMELIPKLRRIVVELDARADRMCACFDIDPQLEEDLN